MADVMPDPAARWSHLLVEWEAMDDLLLPLSGSARLKYTCIAVSRKYIALGSTTGGIFIFGRESKKQLKIIFADGENAPVSHVALSPNENLLGFANSASHVVMMDMNLEKRSKPEKLRLNTEHTNNSVTTLQWDSANTRLYAGDAAGLVSVTFVPGFKTFFTLPTEVKMRLKTSVIQLDWLDDRILVSTLDRSYLCNTDKEQYSQLGKKLRDGKFGACFVQCDGDSIILCGRPGSRMWEVNLDGTVLKTHQFKQLLAIPSLPVITYRKNDVAFPDNDSPRNPQSINFPKMYVLSNRFILTWNSGGLYIFDPIHVNVVLWSETLTDVDCVSCLNNEIYIFLHSGNIHHLTLLPVGVCFIELLSKKKYEQARAVLEYFQSSLISRLGKYIHMPDLHDFKTWLDDKYAIDLSEIVEDLIAKFQSESDSQAAHGAIGSSSNVQRLESGIYVINSGKSRAQRTDSPSFKSTLPNGSITILEGSQGGNVIMKEFDPIDLGDDLEQDMPNPDKEDFSSQGSSFSSVTLEIVPQKMSDNPDTTKWYPEGDNLNISAPHIAVSHENDFSNKNPLDAGQVTFNHTLSAPGFSQQHKTDEFTESPFIRTESVPAKNLDAQATWQASETIIENTSVKELKNGHGFCDSSVDSSQANGVPAIAINDINKIEVDGIFNEQASIDCVSEDHSVSTNEVSIDDVVVLEHISFDQISLEEVAGSNTTVEDKLAMEEGAGIETMSGDRLPIEGTAGVGGIEAGQISMPEITTRVGSIEGDRVQEGTVRRPSVTSTSSGEVTAAAAIIFPEPEPVVKKRSRSQSLTKKKKKRSSVATIISKDEALPEHVIGRNQRANSTGSIRKSNKGRDKSDVSSVSSLESATITEAEYNSTFETPSPLPHETQSKASSFVEPGNALKTDEEKKADSVQTIPSVEAANKSGEEIPSSNQSSYSFDDIGIRNKSQESSPNQSPLTQSWDEHWISGSPKLSIKSLKHSIASKLTQITKTIIAKAPETHPQVKADATMYTTVNHPDSREPFATNAKSSDISETQPTVKAAPAYPRVNVTNLEKCTALTKERLKNLHMLLDPQTAAKALLIWVKVLNTTLKDLHCKMLEEKRADEDLKRAQKDDNSTENAEADEDDSDCEEHGAKKYLSENQESSHFDWTTVCHMTDIFHLDAEVMKHVSELAMVCFESGCHGNVSTYVNPEEPSERERSATDPVMDDDLELAYFVRCYFCFMSVSRIKDMIERRNEASIQTWFAFTVCLKELGSGDPVDQQIKVKNVSGAFDLLKSGILPNKEALLGHVVSLFGLSPLTAVDFCLSQIAVITPLDIYFMCLRHNKPLQQFFSKYMIHRLTVMSGFQKAKTASNLCSNRHVRIALLKGLLNAKTDIKDAKLLDGSPRPGSHLLVKWTHQEIIDIILQLYMPSDSHRFLSICKEKGYWLGCISLLVHDNKITDVLKLIFQLGDIEFLKPNNKKGYSPKSIDEWEVVIRLRRNECKKEMAASTTNNTAVNMIEFEDDTNELSKQASNWISSITWENLAKLLIENFGAQTALNLLTKYEITHDALSQEFYQYCIREELVHKQQRLLMHNMLEKIAMHLWTQNQTKMAPQLHRVVSEEKKMRAAEQASDHGAVFSRLMTTDQVVHRFAEDPECHWGVATNISSKCWSCDLPLQQATSSDEPGVLIFECGHGYHKFCNAVKMCLVCPQMNDGI